MSGSGSQNIPDEIKKLASEALQETLPAKSKQIYERTYDALKTSMVEKNT